MSDSLNLTEASSFFSNHSKTVFADERFEEKQCRLKKMVGEALVESDDWVDALLDISILQLSGELMWQLIKPCRPEVLVGVGLRGMPLLHAVASAAYADGHGTQVLMVREHRKTHNQKKWVEGAASSENATAIFISDHFADAAVLSFVKSALEADNYIVDIQAISMMLDLTTYADLGYPDFEIGRITSIFSADEFAVELTHDVKKLFALMREYRVQSSVLQGIV